MLIAFKVNGLLQYRRQLEQQKSDIIEIESNMNKLRLQHIYKLNRFSSYLHFETHQCIQIKHIENGHVKFNRCQKALLDNSKDTFFTQDSILSQYYDKLELIEAFKIENNVLLRDFEASLRKYKSSFLKGLFVPISKKNILQLCLFGFKAPKTGEDQQAMYRSKFLQIP